MENNETIKDMEDVLDKCLALLLDSDKTAQDFVDEHVESFEYIVTPANRTYAGAFLKLRGLWGQCWLDTFNRLLILEKDGHWLAKKADVYKVYEIDDIYMNEF